MIKISIAKLILIFLLGSLTSAIISSALWYAYPNVILNKTTEYKDVVRYVDRIIEFPITCPSCDFEPTEYPEYKPCVCPEYTCHGCPEYPKSDECQPCPECPPCLNQCIPPCKCKCPRDC